MSSLCVLVLCMCSHQVPFSRCTGVYRHCMPVGASPRLSANCSRQVWLWIPFFGPYTLNYTDRHFHSSIHRKYNCVLIQYLSTNTHAIPFPYYTSNSWCAHFPCIEYFCFFYFYSIFYFYHSNSIHTRYENTWSILGTLMTLCHRGAFAIQACLCSLEL